MKRQRIASVISTEVQKSTILLINALVSDETERLTRSSPDSLAATLAAQPSMSLVPLAPFLDSARNDKEEILLPPTCAGLLITLSMSQSIQWRLNRGRQHCKLVQHAALPWTQARRSRLPGWSVPIAAKKCGRSACSIIS